MITTNNNQPLEKCTLYVARPGPTSDNIVDSNAEKPDTSRWSSSDETALTKDGITSAEAIRDAFKDIHFNGAYCSRAKRTYDTAKIILGDQKIEIKPRKKFYEMRIGPTAGMTPEDIKKYFLAETEYTNYTKERFPKLWAKRQGGPIEANDIHLDKWRDDIDTFDDFSAKFIERIKKFTAKNLGKTLLIVPHGTPMKAMIAEAKGTTSDRVNCAKGSYYKIEIDANGHFFLQEDMQQGISIS
jgi:phosphoserine phosphatase